MEWCLSCISILNMFSIFSIINNFKLYFQLNVGRRCHLWRYYYKKVFCHPKTFSSWFHSLTPLVGTLCKWIILCISVKSYFMKNTINHYRYLSMLNLRKIVFPPHRAWSENGDQSHSWQTLCKHNYQGHWRKANYHQDNQSHWDGANSHKSGCGRWTFHHQTYQGHWESTIYYTGHKGHWRSVFKMFESTKIVYIWNGDLTNKNCPPFRSRCWHKETYRLVSLEPKIAWQLRRFFTHLLTSLLTNTLCWS